MSHVPLNMTAPSCAERKLLEEFREKVGDVLKCKEQKKKSYLIRWLRARDLDLEKAEEMLRASLQWREKNNIDRVLEVPLDPFFAKEFPYYIENHDKAHQPVVFLPVGKWDFRHLVSEGKMEQFKVFIAHLFETIMGKIRHRNRDRDPQLYPVTQFTIIVDWGGFCYMQLMNMKAVHNVIDVAAAFEAHYPEVMCRAYFINCPTFFNLIFPLIKNALHPHTLAKITQLGWNMKEWDEVLGKEIDEERLSIILRRAHQNQKKIY